MDFVIIDDNQAFNRRHIEWVHRLDSTTPHPQGRWILKILANGQCEDYRFKTKKHRDAVWFDIVTPEESAKEGD